MLLERKKRHKVNHEGSWAVSYVDMLTLLLCFFIIFFNSKAITNEDDDAVLKKVLRSMTKNKDGTSGFNDVSRVGCANGGTQIDGGACSPSVPTSVANGTGAGSGTGTGTGTGTGSGSGSASGVDLMEQIKISFDSIAKAKTVVLNKALILDFDNISFFKSGSTKISPQGQESITQIISSLKPYQDSIKITVQGHTDSLQVRSHKAQFSDNWELSVLRATAVLKSFVRDGFPPQMLTAEGYADTQAITEKTDLNDPNLRTPANLQDPAQSRALDRKITFRIELRNQP
jgi:chemotaxis protein MotB